MISLRITWRRQRARGNELIGNQRRIRFYDGEARDAGRVLFENGDKDFNVLIIMGNSLGFSNEDHDSETLRGLLTVAAKGCIVVIQTENRDWRIRNFQPYINFEFEQFEVFQNWNLNFETSTASGRTKFYRKDRTNTKLGLALDLVMTIRLCPPAKGVAIGNPTLETSNFSSDATYHLIVR
jgi:hypothetical protein